MPQFLPIQNGAGIAMLDITFITIAQNEERNIVGCIDSARDGNI
jgi:hypothetical protein